MDNSGGGQTWVTSDKWGPLKGMLLHLLVWQSSALRRDAGEGGRRGFRAARSAFRSSSIPASMRARFNPVDGQLYVAGLKGWQTNGAKDAAFQRVRYTGQAGHPSE